MGAEAVSHGVAKEGSPRREPWDNTPSAKAPSGAPSGAIEFSQRCGFRFPIPDPRLKPRATFYRRSASTYRLSVRRTSGYLEFTFTQRRTSKLKDRMPAGRRKTIEHASDQEIRALLIAGTL